ncbi:MAG: hypothetical protein AAF702_50525 [Chloroflexota bacterium]
MRNRVERKAKLMEKAEEEIEKLLDWMEETEAPDLSSIEDIVLKLRKRIGEGMTEEVIENQESVRMVPGPACPECKEEMHYKGMKGKSVSSEVGEVNLNRGYYYCDSCRRGLFPPR